MNFLSVRILYLGGWFFKALIPRFQINMCGLYRATHKLQEEARQRRTKSELDNQKMESNFRALLITMWSGTNFQLYRKCPSFLNCQMGGWLTALRCYDWAELHFIYLQKSIIGRQVWKWESPEVPASLQISWVIFSRSLNFIEPKFSHLLIEDDKYWSAVIKNISNELWWKGFVILRCVRIT